MEGRILTGPQIAGLCRGLSLLLHSGISPAEGVFLLAREEQKDISDLLTALGRRLDEGAPLSTAMEESRAFPGYVTAMAAIGEGTGRMEESLLSIAVYYEERQRIQRLLRSAVAYPAMILLLMLAVVGVLLIKVLPVFQQVYASLGSGLTGFSAALLGLGQALEGALPLLFWLLALLTIAGLLLFRVPRLRSICLSWLKSRLGDRGICREFNNVRFARALAMGLGSGLPLEASLELARTLLSDVPGAAKRCGHCTQLLCQGRALDDALGEARLLPPAHCRLLALGLRSGSADRVMEQIADRMAEDAAYALEEKLSRVEPAMVVISSLLVGMILLSVMLPLMNILSSLG